MSGTGSKTLYLPNQSRMVMTSVEDPISYYYKPHTAWLYRRRLELGLALLGDEHYRCILEIGYGSGILLPTLATYCEELYGLDLHENVDPVHAMLRQEGVRAELLVGDVVDMCYLDQTFDAVVCLSVLEHLEPCNLELAAAQIARVLRPGGVAVLGFPVRNIAMNIFCRLEGFDPAKLHPSSHRQILAAIRAMFGRVYVRRFPNWLPLDLALYVAVRVQC